MAKYGRARSARGKRHRTSKRKSGKKRRSTSKRRQKIGKPLYLRSYKKPFQGTITQAGGTFAMPSILKNRVHNSSTTGFLGDW